MTTTPTGRVKIGWATLTGIPTLSTHREAGMKNDNASFVIDPEVLKVPGVAYLGEVRIEAVHPGIAFPIFTGLVDSVEHLDNGQVKVNLNGLKRDLETTQIGGLVTGAGTDGREIIYSLIRLTDFPLERIKIQDWRPGPREKFIVTAPVIGLTTSGERQIGDVRITNSNSAQLDMPSDELVEQFKSAAVWATTTVEAETLLDAETAGLESLRLGLSLIRLIAGFSYPVFDGKLRTFKWSHTRARPTLSNLVYVGSLANKRSWLRKVDDLNRVEALHLEDLALPNTDDLARRVPSKRLLHRAVREWNSAADASDDFTRTTHLWRAIECYATGVRVDNLFSRDQLKRVVKSASNVDEWTPDQIKRIESLSSRFNEVPLLVKFKKALELDGVQMTDDEFDAIVGTRSLRNRLEHGQELSRAEHRALEIAIGVTNKILLTAIMKIGKRSSTN